MNWLLTRAIRYGYARAREASTWRNLVLLAGGSWTAAHPEQAELLIPLCLGLAGFVGSFFPDVLGAPPSAEVLPPIDLIGESQTVRVDGDPRRRASDSHPDSDRLPQRPVRAVHNTHEAADSDFPGWGS